MDVGSSGGLDDLIHPDFTTVVAVCDVLTDRRIEQDRFLRHDAHL